MMRGNAWSRSAEEFDALVSGRTGDATSTSHAQAELLELVSALRAVPPVTARPEFVASLRTQLVAAAEREPARVEEDLTLRLTPRQRRGSRERRLAAVIGGFAVVSATGSMAMASQDALPGDVLYPVKRAIENAQTNLQPDGAAKADALVSHAEARLDELQTLMAGAPQAEEVNATLQDFTDQARQASEFALDDYAASGDEARIVDLRAFAADSMDVLGGLGPVVPSDSRALLITATQTIRQIDAAAWEACPSCAGGAVAEMPDFATIPLSNVLSGTMPASVTETQPPAKPKKAKAPQGATPPAPSTASEPALPELPGDVAPELPEITKKSPKSPVGETVEGVTNGVTGTLGIDGQSQTTDSTQPTLTGTLVDGVEGVLGGLLGTGQ